MLLNFFIAILNGFLKYLNIRKHGYPPETCDSIGDFKEEIEGEKCQKLDR